MEKKRLVLSRLLVLTIILSLSLIHSVYSQEPAFEKEQVLTISGDDGTSKNDDSCTQKQVTAFKPGLEIETSEGIFFRYQRNAQTNSWGYEDLNWEDDPVYAVLKIGEDDYDGYENADTYKLSSCVWSKDKLTKKLKTLKGCAFLVEEFDGESNYPDDCGGWLIPPEEKSIINSHSKYGTENEPSLLSAQEYLDNSFFKLGILEDVVLNGQTDFDGGSTSYLDCQMKQNYFSTTGEAYICLDNKEATYDWYKCDKELVGQYINYTPSTGKAWFCVEDTSSTVGGYTWIKQQIKCDTDKHDCDKDMIACVNTYGEKETKEDGTIIGGTAWNEQAGCCGDDGLDDFGKISEDKRYLCFNDLITLESISYGESTGKTMFQVYSEIKSNYQDGWRWISASEDAGIFKIKTKVDTNQDILSNGMYWYTCDKTNEGELKKEGIGSSGDFGKAGRFFCLANATSGYWKECLSKDATEEEKGKNSPSRQVLFGESLLTLYPHDEKASISYEGQTAAPDVPVQYEVKASIPSDTLKIVFKFTDDPLFMLATKKILPKVSLLGISSKDKSLGDNLLDYAAVPYLENEVPLNIYLPSYGEPTILSPFAAQIKKVYGIGSGNNLFCSGKEEFGEGKSSWIADLDDSPKLTEGKTACEANGFTWTGTQCCGDDAVKLTESLEDFYANDGTVIGLDEEEKPIFDETKPKGCWAGIPLKEGEAIGEIKFTISAGGKTLEETYPCKKETGKECRYFIKGIIGEDKVIEKVKLANLYPERYDLVAKPFNKLGEDQNLKDIKITGDGVEVDRIKYYLEAKNVPAMAIVGKDEEGNPKFLTCGADLSGMGTDLAQNMPLCAISGDNYCSANGWTSKAPAKFEFDSVMGYSLEPSSYEPEVLFDHSSSIVFGRNLIPNANFVMTEENIAGWKKEGKYDENQLPGLLKVENGILSLSSGNLLSSPIYLENKSYTLSFSAQCSGNGKMAVYLYPYPFKGIDANQALMSQILDINSAGKEKTFSLQGTPQKSSNYWIELVANEFIQGCTISNLTLYLTPLEFNTVPFNYEELHQPITAQQCCPENSCWNGFTCVGDMSEQTEREETVAEGVSYRCLKGNWVVQEKKWDWANKVKGYCEKETQCFVAPITPTGDAQGATAGVAAKEFYDGGVTPSCINDTEFIFDHYCQEGEWTTRTKFLIESLQSLAKKNSYPKYTLYCSPYTETLNEYGSEVYDQTGYLRGNGNGDATNLPGCSGFDPNAPECKPKKICFEGANQNLISNEENTCVNNFCLLTHEEDKQQKTIFAVSLNQPIDDTSNSFLQSLGIDNPEEIKSYCPTEGEDWVDCKETVGFLKYHPKLNMVAYSSTKFDFELGTLAKFWDGVKDAVDGAIDFVGGLFGLEVEKIEPGQLPGPLAEPITQQLIPNAFALCPAQDTSRYFFFFGNGKSAKACVWNNTLSASYHNFVTPICEYASHTLKEKQWWLVEEAHEGKELPLQGEPSLFCDSQSKSLIIKDPNDIAFWWPQLTGRLRIN